MEQGIAPPSLVWRSSGQEARYVYGVARCRQEVSLGDIGIEGREVYTVAYKDVAALVHDCPEQPYASGDTEVATAWVLAHHGVVEAAWKRWGTVLPLTFNTIIRRGPGSAEDGLLTWLEREYDWLIQKLEAMGGKAEYGVQVFWEPAVLSQKVAGSHPEIRKLEGEMHGKPRGVAYMYRQRLESLLRKEVEALASQAFQDLYGRLKGCVDCIRIDKPKKVDEGWLMLMNLSCLVSRERYSYLEAELDRLSQREGYSVRLVGPLPPYSFC